MPIRIRFEPRGKDWLRRVQVRLRAARQRAVRHRLKRRPRNGERHSFKRFAAVAAGREAEVSADAAAEVQVVAVAAAVLRDVVAEQQAAEAAAVVAADAVARHSCKTAHDQGN